MGGHRERLRTGPAAWTAAARAYAAGERPPPSHEFLVAAIDHYPAAALALDDAIRKSVVQRASATQALAQPRAGVGIAHATPASGYDLERLLQRADAALYAAKRSGRDRVAIEDERDTAPTDQPSLRQLSVTATAGKSAGTLVN